MSRAAGFQLRQQRARHPHQPHDVRVVHPLPVFIFRIRELIEAQRPARVVDQHMNFWDLRAERLHTGCVRHIQRQTDRAERFPDLPQLLQPPRPQDQRKPRVMQRDRRRRSDPAARSRHHRNPLRTFCQ